MVPHVGDDREDIVDPVCRQGWVVSERIGGGLARVRHPPGSLDRLTVGQEFALEQQVNSHHGCSSCKQCLDPLPGTPLVIKKAPLALLGEPDHCLLVPFFRVEKQDRKLPTVSVDIQNATDLEVIPLVDLGELLVIDRGGTWKPCSNHRVNGRPDHVTIAGQRFSTSRDQVVQLVLGIVVPVLEQPLLELVSPGRPRVIIVPDGERFRILEVNLCFRRDLVIPQAKMLVHPTVHGDPAYQVVVVLELDIRCQHHVLFPANQLVESQQLGKPLGLHFPGPVIGGCQAKRPGSEECSEVNIPRADSQAGGILAGTASLHCRGDHDRGHGNFQPGIYCREHEGLRAPSTCPGDCQAIRVHILECQQEIHCPYGTPCLQPHHTLQVGFRLRAKQAPLRCRVHPGPLRGKAVGNFKADLRAVRIANHVVMKHDTAHPRQVDAACLQWAAGRLEELLRTLCNLALRRFFPVVVKSAVAPVTVGTENPRPLAWPVVGWAIETAGNKKPGHRFKGNFFDTVTTMVLSPMNDRRKRRARRHRPDTLGDEYPPADVLGTARPG